MLTAPGSRIVGCATERYRSGLSSSTASSMSAPPRSAIRSADFDRRFAEIVDDPRSLDSVATTLHSALLPPRESQLETPTVAPDPRRGWRTPNSKHALAGIYSYKRTSTAQRRIDVTELRSIDPPRCWAAHEADRDPRADVHAHAVGCYFTAVN